LQLSDDLLATAWGSMDRYHLAWLSVGKPTGIVRGRPMTGREEADYVREVARQKTAVLRTSLEAASRGMPFVGEDLGTVATDGGAGDPERKERPAPPPRRGPSDPDLARRLAEARDQAEVHRAHEPRAPRPPKMQR
ncbi:MAG TPA: hypothetical protein VF802_08555, partial [Candidatus Limnocylindrales bacterium]